MRFSNFSLENWLSKGRTDLKLFGIAFLLSLCIAFPPVELLPYHYPFFDTQIDNPLTPVHGLDPTSHESKRAFRLTMPVIAHVLHLHQNGAYIIDLIFSYALLYVLGLVLLRLLKDPLPALLATCCFALSYVHQSPMHFAYLWFDGYSFFFLSLCLLLRNSYFFFPAGIAALYCDERCYIGMAFIFYWAVSDYLDGDKLFKKKIYMPVLTVILAVLLRFWLGKQFGLSIATGEKAYLGFNTFFQGLEMLPISVFGALKMLTVILVLAVYHMLLNRWYLRTAMFGALLALALMSTAVVLDSTRSLTHVYPAIFPALAVLHRQLSRTNFVNLLKVCLLVAFLLPTYGFMGKIIYFVPGAPYIRLFTLLKYCAKAVM
ncbi:MAG: hypothetical protein V4543_05180 [Bacteroidota bacterium]